jgi:hypothetical protein
MNRSEYINKYIETFIARWTLNCAAILGKKHVDRPDTTIRMIARTHAETAWDMEHINGKEEALPTLQSKHN